MKRLPHVAILLMVVALVAADKGEKKKSDAEKIQGKWTVAEVYLKGKKQGDMVGDPVTFSGKKMIVARKGQDRKTEHAFELRPDKKPREMDIIFKGGGEEATALAIYELSGDTLKICLAKPGKERPKALGTAPDDDRALMVFKRVY